MLIKKVFKMKEKYELKKFSLKKKTSIVLVFAMTIGMLSGVCTGEMKKVKAAGGTRAELVAVAASQVGYYEKASNAYLDDFVANRGSANYNKYARDVGVANGQAWCATFIWWCMATAGVPYANYPSRTTVTRDWFVQRGQYHARGTYTPQPGDYVVFGNVAHCGIVESVSGGYVTTIEGNSSDQVKRNTYSLTNSYILGYGVINYNVGSSSDICAVNVSNPGSPYPIPTSNIRNGSTGDQVRWVQKFANDVMGAGIAVDGIAGNQTVNAIRQFQSWYGLTADGIAGTITIGKMLEVWREKTGPVNLGDSFAGIILRTDVWKSIRNNGSNVEMWDEAANAQYRWLFTRQGDGSYIIKSLYDGKVLDVYGAGTANATNVWTYPQSSGVNNAQRWYVYPQGNSYKLVPKLATNMALDDYCAAMANGSNIVIHEQNGSAAQGFSIYKIAYNELKGISIKADNKEMYIGDTQTLKCELSPSNASANMVKWESSNSSVATVDGNGKVVAKAEGTTTIKCVSTYNSNIYGTVTITVTKKPEPTTEEITTEETTETTNEATTEDKTEETTTEETTTEETTTEETTETTNEATTEETTENKTEETTEDRTEETTENKTEETTEVNNDTPIEDSQAVVPPGPSNTEDKPDVTIDNNVNNDVTGDVEEEYEEFELVDETAAAMATGKTFKDTKNKCIFEITNASADSPEVAYVKPVNSKCTKIVIPDTVTKDGVTYKVTVVKDNAAANNKKLTEVTFGKNIEKIGKAAFKGCKKLKNITIKGTKLKVVAKNAFKNTASKKVIKVPKSKSSEYKAMLSKAGAK